MSGRGAWNVQGVGGTKQYKDATKPGPYYFTGTGYVPAGHTRDENEYAVFGAVKAYQVALNAAGVTCLVDGLYGPATTKAMTAFQERWKATGDPLASVWGGVGPETSEKLLRPALDKTLTQMAHNALITAKVVSGVVRTESRWDAGAVGAADVRDVGLAQINAAAHPDLDTDERLTPQISFQFVVSYLNEALSLLVNNLRDAIASYNLGVAGARKWIAAGRPDLWAPPGTDPNNPRNVRAYIDNVLLG
jgi:peptidoglycan hydrolase-like protein with peptidoglycan-binding domain